jgi:hypothetical protein
MDLIGERKLYTAGEQDYPALVVRIFTPFQPEDDYPRCRYEIVGERHRETREITGADAIDSLVSCLMFVGSTIAGLNESLFEGRLLWEASDPDDVAAGFPTIDGHWLARSQYQQALEWGRHQNRPGSE